MPIDSTRLLHTTSSNVPSTRTAVKYFGKQLGPAVAERLAEMAGGFSTNLFLARSANPNNLPASALIATIQQFLMSVNAMLLSGANIKAGDSHNEQDAIGPIFRNTATVASILSITTALLTCFSKDILIGIGQNDDVAEIVQQYFRAWAIGIFPEMMITVQKFCVSGLQDSPWSISVVELFTSICSTSLGYLMINGSGTLPAMGAAGLGYAISISNWAAFIGYSVYLKFSQHYPDKWITYNVRDYIESPVMSNLLKAGIPAGIMIGSELGTVFAGSIMAGKLGKSSLGAQDVSMQYYLLVLAIIMACAKATMSAAARSKNDIKFGTTKQIVSIANGAGLAFCVIAGIISVIFRRQLSSYFINNQENDGVLPISEKLLWVNSIFMPFDSIRFITSFAALALDQGPLVLLSTIAGLVMIGLPLSAALGFATTLGIVGMTIGRGIGVATGAGINIIAARRGMSAPTVEQAGSEQIQ